MLPVLASLVALGVGPALVAAARRRRWLLGAVDGFVVVSIGGIVLLHILPHAFLVGGGVMLALAALGLFGPALLERLAGPRLPTAARWMLPMALAGLGLHALIDGAVLVEAHHGHGHTGHNDELMAAGVVLHRVPEGLVVWWVFRRNHGLGGAALALAFIGAATTLGFVLGEQLEGALGPLHGLQALVAGSLLHVIFHRSHDLTSDETPHSPATHACELDFDEPPPHDHHDHGPLASPPAGEPAATASGASVVVEPSPPGVPDDIPLQGSDTARPWGQLASASGALLGVAMLWGISLAHPASHRISSEIGMGATFVTLALESAPALLLSYLAVGLAHAFWPNGATRWLSRGGRVGQALRALALGPLVPVCSCGVLPLYRGLIARATPPVAAMTLLVAAPEIGLATVFLSVSLLGAKMALARLAGALLVALLVGAGVGALVAPDSPPEAPPASARTAPAGRLRDGLLYAATDVIDHTFPWILLGLGVAAFVEPSLSLEAIARAGRGHDVVLFAALGIPLYVSASGATPLVAVLLHKGLSSGAALAFLLTGPATNLSTIGVLSRLHGPRVAWVFALAMFALPTALGLAFNALSGPVEPVALHAAAHSPPDLLNVACLLLLLLLALASLARRGPRFWVEQIVASEHHHPAGVSGRPLGRA